MPSDRPAAGSLADPGRLEAVQRTGLLEEHRPADVQRQLRIALRGLDAAGAAFLLVSGEGFHCRGAEGLPASWTSGAPWPLDWPFLLETAFEGPVAVGRANLVGARLSALPDSPFRAYAGAPVQDPDGNRVGLLAVWGAQARAWKEEEIDFLRESAGALEDLVARRLDSRRREADLRAAGDRLRVAVECGSDLMYEWDVASGDLRLVGSMEEMLGYGPGELPPSHGAWQKVLHPEDRERVEARLRRHLEEGEPFFEEYRVLRKDGSIRHWSDRGKAIRDAAGRPVKWLGMVNDITGRKRMEEALSRSREERDVILGTVESPVLARDPSGRVVFANPAAARLLGFDGPEALMAAPRRALEERFALADAQGRALGPEEFPGMPALRGMAQSAAVIRFTDRGTGRVFWAAVNATPVADSHGRVRLSIAAFHDITALQEAQAGLARSRDEMDAILRAMNYGVIALDGTGRRLYANPAAARQHGCASVEELLALPPEALSARYEVLDEAGRLQPPGSRPVARALRGERVEEELISCRMVSTGEVKQALEWAIPVFDPAGAVRLVISMMQDVTALKQAQNDLSRSRDELEAILRTMDSACTAQDPSGNLIFANRAAAERLGFRSPEALLAAGPAAVMERFEVVDAEGRPFPRERFPGRRALQGEAVQGELMGYRVKATGEMMWSLVNGTPVFDGQGRVRMAVNVFHDVTASKRAEEALVESRQRLKLVFENVNDMVVLTSVDPDGGFRVIMANPAYLARTRLPKDRLIGARPEELLPPEEAERVVSQFRRVAEGKRPVRLEWMSAGLERRVMVESAMTPILDESGRCTHILTVNRDVTDRKEAEEMGARHLRFLERTDAVSRAAEGVLDSEKVLPAALARVLQVMGCRQALLVHPADPDAPDYRIPFLASADGQDGEEMRFPGGSPFREVVRQVLQGEGPRPLRGPELPDPRFWSGVFGADSLLAMAVRPRAGKPWLFCLLRGPGDPAWSSEDFTAFRDIAARVTAALGNTLLYRDLRRSEEKYRTLFERSLDGVFRCAPDGTVLDANPALVELLGGASRADLVGTVERQLLPAGAVPEGRQAAREPFIVELRRRDGGKVWAEVIAQAIRRADGEVACYEGMVRNIDDRKRTEAALKESEEVLRQAQKMEAVGRLAGGVAHDFNNLLTAINGFGDLLLMQVPKDDPRRMHVEEIRKAGERAAGLTSQLLSFSRKQVLAPRQLDLNAVVAGMEPMLRRLIGENIDFAVEPARDLPKVVADPTQVEQIVMNLALNARDAMPTGGRLRIATALRKLPGEAAGKALLEARDGDYVMLSVTDTGTGMDDETKSRLFEPFFTTKEKDKGTGLGLSMVYGAVKQGNGTIEVDTKPSRGTAFRVYLPVAAGTEVAAAAGRPAGRIPASTQGTETILLVEDEDAVRRLVRDVLAFNGYRVLEAPGGEKALEVAERHKGAIHLLLTDVVMGGMSGRELAERLRAVRPDTRILYMSGYTEDAIIRHGVQSSQTAFIGKPFTPMALATKVREVLTSVPAAG